MNHDDSFVCHRCFRDKTLIDFIREQGKRSWCDWCGARNVYVVPLYMLGDIFRDAVSIYVQDDSCSDSISYILQDEWEVFSDKIEQDPDLMQDMTVAILMAGLDPKDYFADYPDFNEGFRGDEEGLVEHWHQKAEDYFASGKTDLTVSGRSSSTEDEDYAEFPDQLEVAFEDLSIIYEPGKILYRE